MGVIYKLKKDVVDYIVSQKRHNPQISCRSLAGLVNEKFRSTISKSSVNAVLLQSQLSSPVGRRPLGQTRPKKFSIPPKRKEHLFAGAAQPGAIPRDVAGTPPSVKKQAKKPEEKAPKKAAFPDGRIENPPFTGKPPGPSLPPEGKNRFPAGGQDKGILYDGMGCFFLKAAEWLLSETSILGQAAHKFLTGVSRQELDAICETGLYFEAFGLKEVQDIDRYDQQGLWILNGLTEKVSSSKLIQVMEGIKDIKGFNIEMSNQIVQMAEEMSSIKVTLADQKEFFLDAQLSTIWPGNVQTGFSIANQKAIALMSKQIINNLSPAVICCAPGAESFSPEFFDLVASFENLPGKEIITTTLLDTRDQDIAEFSVIPQQKRFFIIGVWPWQEEFSRLKEEAQKMPSHVFAHPILEREVYYSEAYTNLLNEYIDSPLAPSRVFLIKETSEGEAVMAILSNLSSEKQSAQDIVASYFLRWPNLQRGHNILLIRNPEKILSQKALSGPSSFDQDLSLAFKGTTSLRGNFYTLLGLLNGYCQKHFFPFHYDKMDVQAVISRFFRLPGFYKKDQKFIIVHLVLPEQSYLYREDLEYAIKRVNETEVCDYQGRKLVLALDKS